ncbi:MAG TPA: metallophosphoesterase family protein [Anaerolineaceae bacterium]
MKIGIISDTHNNLKNLEIALRHFRDNGITTVIHCGDLTEVETAQALQGFQVLCALGNGDILSGEIRQALLAQRPDNYVGLVYRGEIGGARVAVTHGHIPGMVEELARSGQFDYVFKGHSHQHKDERIGFTRLINPGALGGLHREPRHYCLLDLDTGIPQFLQTE